MKKIVQIQYFRYFFMIIPDVQSTQVKN